MPVRRSLKPDVIRRLALDEDRLAAFCTRWRIASLELFGSILRDDFSPDSDIDLLVTVRPNAAWGLLDHAVMEEELAELLGRPVDLISRRAVERSTNVIRRTSILASATLLFAAQQRAGHF